jgi:uncharacterized membrane protein YqjE
MDNKDKPIAVEREPEGLPALFTRMADDLTQFFDTKLALLKVEIKEDIDAYISGGIMILVGGVVVAVGFALLNVAVAFLVSVLFENSNLSQPVRYALGFIITALVYLIAGAVTIIVTKNRLAQQGIVPKRTLAELERDKEWLQKEV